MLRSDPLGNCSSRVDRDILKEVSKNLVMPSSDIHASLATVNIKVHASSIKKELHKLNFRVRWARKKLLLSEKQFKTHQGKTKVWHRIRREQSSISETIHFG